MSSDLPPAAALKPPYYAVIFTSQRTEDDRGYERMAERMVELAARQPGFLGIESVRDVDGRGITVSYWASEEAIAAWKAHLEHRAAQQEGIRRWYAHYNVRVAKVERAYERTAPGNRRNELDIRLDTLDSREMIDLLAEHLRAMSETSPPESIHALGADELRKPDVTLWSAWDGTELAGCGALKELDATHGEIKFMRTVASRQRRGVASALLRHMLEEAKRRGYRRLSLETGSMAYFEPARSLYRKFGFEECPPFADYVDDPNSVFMTLEL